MAITTNQAAFLRSLRESDRNAGIRPDPVEILADAVGYRLPWSAYVGGRFVYADTLDGIKAMIRDEVSA